MTGAGGGKRYSAGAIFLQVVPVFANVQKLIEAESEKINRALGDDMERAGEKAGQRAGKAASKSMNDEFRKGTVDMERDFKRAVEGMGNALDDIDMRKLSGDVKREVAKIKAELASIHDIDISVDADFKDAHQKLLLLEHRLEKVGRGVPIVLRANIDDVASKVAKTKAMLESIDDTLIDVNLNTKPAERKLGVFEKAFKKAATAAGKHLGDSVHPELRRIAQELDDLSKMRIGIDITSDMALRQMERLRREAEFISANDVDIQVQVDSGAAEAELATLLATIKKLDSEDVDIDVKTNARRAGRDADQAANSFRSFNIILFAAATAGPALVPVLGAIAGGLLAIGPAAAVAAFGLGSVLVGFSGIGDALTALGNQQDQAAMTAQTAARSEAAAAKSVANARRSAARQIESALERQRDAQERYRDSIEDVKEAEEALREARKAAANNGADLDRAVRENKLAIDQALLDSFDATVNYNAVMNDGSATNAEKEQARIDREAALLQLEELRAQQRELAAEKKKWDEEGVNGTDEVQNAQDRLNDAIEAQKEAYQDLGEAARDVDRARADGARAVADALSAQEDALAGVNAQQNAVDSAFRKLGPAGEKFALFLFGLRGAFYRFRDDIQSVMLPSIQEAIEGFLGSGTGKVARSALIALAADFGEFVKALSVSFQGEAWTGFFEMLGTVGPQIQQAWGGAFIALMEGIASILTTSAPFALEFARGLERMMQSFADWAASEEGQKSLLGFLDWVREIAPDVLAFISAFVRGMADVAVALAPLGDLVLKGLTNFFETLADMDPTLLSALATGLVVLIGASQTAYLVMNLLMAGSALLSSTVGIWVFAFVAIAAAFAFLYKQNEKFADFVDEAWDRISSAVMDAWDKYLKPALADLGDALKQLWDEILQPFFAWLGPILIRFFEVYLPAYIAVLSGVFRALAWGIREIVIPWIQFWWEITGPIFRAFGRLLGWLWKKAVAPTIAYFKKHWPEISDAIQTAWEDYIQPAFSAMADGIRGVQDAFETVADAIGRIWRGIRNAVSDPVRFIVNTVLRDGLVAGINRVLKWVNLDPINFPGFTDLGRGASAGANISRATGGVLPGYTPGRDVHDFYSPTAGRLHLSGGEAIMRPEWTAAMGKGYIDSMNAAARQGGIKGVRRAMGMAFAKGGVFWPLPNSTASTYAGHDGVDLNAPNDLGKPFYSATKGTVSYTGWNRGYGNAVFVNSPYGELVYGHSIDGSIRVRQGQSVVPGTWLANVGSTGRSSGPHLHFGFPGGTYAQAMALLSGATQITGEMKAAATSRIPGWVKELAKDPVGYAKSLVAEPIKDFRDKFTSSPIVDALVAVPGRLVKGVGEKMWDLIPGPVKAGIKAGGNVIDKGKDVAGSIGEGLGNLADGLGLKDGGILPYNGTMMYDNGGYLPPGLTNVVNLTGKPEPVFTAGQFKAMEGGRGEAGTIHYEPHFEGSDLTAEDVASNLNQEFRKIRRRGKYAGVGDQ